MCHQLTKNRLQSKKWITLNLPSLLNILGEFLKSRVRVLLCSALCILSRKDAASLGLQHIVHVFTAEKKSQARKHTL